MNRLHFKNLHPICPLCRSNLNQDSLLKIGFVTREQSNHILEGALQCTHTDCLYEFPIIDGIPILVPDPRAYIANNITHIDAREDLTPQIESMLGECCGPGSSFDTTRQHLSSYTWDHYGEFDPLEAQAQRNQSPGSVVRALEAGLSLIQTDTTDVPAFTGPVIDLGCAVGRTTFELARHTQELVLGVDMNFSMLRLASSILQYGTVRYNRRKVGMVYDRREFPARFENNDNIDFWVCDAVALPFADDSFAGAVSMNLLDAVYSPLDFLRSVARVLRPGGHTVLASPYDWSGAATAIEGWIGGHSPRSPGEGESEPVLRALLTPGGHPGSVQGLQLVSELEDVPWHVRLHDRSMVAYKLHLITAIAQQVSSADGG